MFQGKGLGSVAFWLALSFLGEIHQLDFAIPNSLCWAIHFWITLVLYDSA